MTTLFIDSHMHTPLCKHAVGEPEEYAAAAQQRGLKGIVFTCHNPIPNHWAASVRMAPEEFDTYLSMIERARVAWKGRVEVRLGLECDYVPGMEPWLKQQLARADFDYILGSVHPQLPEYKAEYFKGNVAQFQRTYFEHLAMAAETRLFDALAHPDLVKNVFPQEWDEQRMMDDIRLSLDRIALTGTAMELNTSGLLKVITEMNPSRAILNEMRRRGIPVVVGSDSHKPSRVGAEFEQALLQLQEAGFSHVSVFSGRKPTPIAIAEAKRDLKC